VARYEVPGPVAASTEDTAEHRPLEKGPETT
jgi:hypothetical protein